MWRVVGGVGRGFGGYQPGVYLPGKALFLVLHIFSSPSLKDYYVVWCSFYM